LNALFPGHIDPGIQLSRLATVVSSAIFEMVGALLPIILARSGLAELTAWRAASALFLVLDWLYIAVLLRALRSIWTGPSSETPKTKAVTFSIERVVQGLLLLSALGVFAAALPAVYLVALTLGLCQMGSIFMRLV
jgi:hypothetical protein